MAERVRIGTRGSALARWQADHVRDLLLRAWPDLSVEVVVFTTRGDRELAKPLPEIGGKGLFTQELEDALRAGEIDLAVHSLKDLPTEMPEDLTLAAVPPREDPHDVLVSRHGLSLDALPPHPTIGTSSNRRAAQIRLARADARIEPLRGNVDTRVRKALAPDGPYDGVVLARAGLVRLGLIEHITQVLPLDVMLPAPGQGALGVQCRAGDDRVLRLLAPLDDPRTRAAVLAERAFLAGLGGGCALPVAALGQVRDGRVHLQGLYVKDGHPFRAAGEADLDGAEALGRRLAEEVLLQVARVTRPIGGGGKGGRTSSDTRNVPPATVLITRARDQADALARRVREIGMVPVIYPTIRIAPPEDVAALDAALARLVEGAYDWLVLTSVNGVRFVWERLQALGAGGIPEDVRVAVIGPATAQALRNHGIRPALVPDEFVAEGLASALGDVRGQRFLLARADRARPTLREMLTAQGARVDEVVAYRTIIAPPDDPPPEVDIVTFTSPSTVEGFVAALRGRALPSRVRVVCIGPITAQAARRAGLPVHAIAREYTIEGLVQEIEHLNSIG
ncbi:MAG: hydroxymethylbilane synthase [Chloroflexi bacterium]|nr:hydroxymethylbilane synthase [Chloroflexota bacterium]